MDTDKEQLIDVIQQQIDATERQMAAMLGQQLYKMPDDRRKNGCRRQFRSDGPEK